MLAFEYRTLLHAAVLVSEMPLDQRTALKVRSGEHLAAILATALFMQAPSEVDTTGGADLVFDAVPTDRCSGLFPPGDQVMEIKSLGSEFRRFDAHKTEGSVHQVTVQNTSSLVDELGPPLIDAARQLARHDAAARHIFVIVHPFERLVVDVVNSPFVGAAMPPLRPPQGVDAVWVLFHPDQLVLWSSSRSCWVQVIFNAFAEDPPALDDQSALLQHAEQVFLASLPMRSRLSSPFLYSFASDSERN